MYVCMHEFQQQSKSAMGKDWHFFLGCGKMQFKVGDVLDMQELSMVRQKLRMVLVRDFGPVMI